MRLTDFGLAKRNINTSQRDTACGTPLYMPPEAIDNMRDGGESASTAAAVSPARHGTASLSSSASCIASSSGGGSTPTNPLCLCCLCLHDRWLRSSGRLVDARHAPIRDALRQNALRAPGHARAVVEDSDGRSRVPGRKQGGNTKASGRPLLSDERLCLTTSLSLSRAPQENHSVSSAALSIMSGLLSKRPQDRLGSGEGSVSGVAQVKSHPWFATIDW